MEGNQEDAVSTQKVLSSSHDPGWNDPPNWAFSPAQKASSGTPTKRLLNKRVAFPLSSNSGTSNTCSNQTLPPLGNIPPPAHISSLTTAPHKPIITPTGAKIEDTKPDDIDKEEILVSILNNLHCVMEQIDSSKTDEIKKRLDRMEAMFNENKLNNTVHRNLLEISKALKEGDAEKADQLHIQLMMNNASVCSLWIPGIRQLIAEIKYKKM